MDTIFADTKLNDIISLEMARKLVAVGFFPYLCRNVFGISEFEFSLICAGVLVGFFCKG